MLFFISDNICFYHHLTELLKCSLWSPPKYILGFRRITDYEIYFSLGDRIRG